MSFAHPLALVALPLVLLGVLAWAFGTLRARRRADLLTRRRAPRPAYLAAFLLALAGSTAVLAAAGPRWGARTLELPREGAEITVILDVSRSMAATDVAPSRITAARTALGASLAGVDGDRVALVVFGGSAYLRFPPTTDVAAAREVVGSLDAGAIFVEPGSSVATGLAAALELPSPPEEGIGRLFVLVSDGDDLGVDPLPLAQRMREDGIDLIVAGVGTPAGGTIPVFDPGTSGVTEKLGPGGEPLVSRLNEDLLLGLARSAGGSYVGSDLSLLPGALNARLASLRDVEIDSRDAEVPIERYQLFAAAALALLILALVVEKLPSAWRQRGAGALAAALLSMLAVGCTEQPSSTNEAGLDAFAAGDYAAAAGQFQRARDADPREFQLSLNLALALFAAGDLGGAGVAAGEASRSARPEIQGVAHAISGHIAFAAGDLPAALDSFRQALRADPRPEYRHDFEVVLRLLTPPPTPTPSPPGASPSPGGESTPAPGGEGTPAPSGSQTPQAGGTPSGEGTPEPGQGNSPLPRTVTEANEQIAAIDATITGLLPDPGQPIEEEDALRILELLAERARLAALRESFGGTDDPGDY